MHVSSELCNGKHLKKGRVHVKFLPHAQLQFKAEEPCDKGTILEASTFLAGAVGSYSVSNYLGLTSSAVQMYAVQAMGRTQVGTHMALSAS